MCGRYGASTVEQIANRFKTDIRITEIKSGYEVFPSQSVPVILQETGLVLDSSSGVFLQSGVNHC